MKGGIRMMNVKEIGNYIKLLNLMLSDLNDMHNNYDIPTGCEDSAREMLKEAINDFNKNQTAWHAELKATKKGWCIKYV